MRPRTRNLVLSRLLGAEGIGDKARAAIESGMADRQHVLPGWDDSFLRQLPGVETVVDVGVLDGTPALYAAFPQAYLVLVEALPECEAKCREIVASRPGEYHICAAGDRDGAVTIRRVPEYPGASSLFELVDPPSDAFEEVSVRSVRLDTLFHGRQFGAEILLKLDCEGAELGIVNGASAFLRQVRYVIAEVSISYRHKASYQFADFIAAMAAQGFAVYDLLRVTRKAVGAPQAEIADMLFKKVDR